MALPQKSRTEMLLMKYLVELGFKIRFESVEKYENQKNFETWYV